MTINQTHPDTKLGKTTENNKVGNKTHGNARVAFQLLVGPIDFVASTCVPCRFTFVGVTKSLKQRQISSCPTIASSSALFLSQLAYWSKRQLQNPYESLIVAGVGGVKMGRAR